MRTDLTKWSPMHLVVRAYMMDGGYGDFASIAPCLPRFPGSITLVRETIEAIENARVSSRRVMQLRRER